MLRIRPQTYYRIELPCNTAEDEASVEEVKKVLKDILQYEVTPCPFKRGFTVDLPEPPAIPIRRVPWKPKVSAASSVLEVPEDSSTTDIVEDAAALETIAEDTSRIQEAMTMASDARETKKLQKMPPAISNGVKSPSVAEMKADIEASEIETRQKVYEPINEMIEELYFNTPTRPKSLRTGRTVTAPPQLSLQTSPPSSSGAETMSAAVGRDRKDSDAPSIESFRSFHSPISPLTPSPISADSSPGNLVGALKHAKIRNHSREPSETTVRGQKDGLWDLTEASGDEDMEYHSPPDLPQSTEPSGEVIAGDADQDQLDAEPSGPRLRLRNSRRQRQRIISPMPSASNLYTPLSPRAHMSGHHLTTAILQRTCSLLLGPPVHLVALMLRIAAKITKGVFQGTAFTVSKDGQHIPCSWDFSDGSGGDEEGSQIGAEDEDDFGFNVRSHISNKERRSSDKGASWEID